MLCEVCRVAEDSAPDEPYQLPSGDWVMWAGIDGSRDFYQHFGDRRYTRAHGVEPVSVVVRESEDGSYWGWIDSPETQARHRHPFDGPVMIQPHLSLFQMQFPYGPQAEVEAGKGRIVRLSVEPWKPMKEDSGGVPD